MSFTITLGSPTLKPACFVNRQLLPLGSGSSIDTSRTTSSNHLNGLQLEAGAIGVIRQDVWLLKKARLTLEPEYRGVFSSVIGVPSLSTTTTGFSSFHPNLTLYCLQILLPKALAYKQGTLRVLHLRQCPFKGLLTLMGELVDRSSSKIV